MQPEDFWFSAPKKGVMVFALPGEPGLTELAGDFKVHFHDRQGDFYLSVIHLHRNKYHSLFSYLYEKLKFVTYLIFSWLNTTMTENRKVLNTNDLDGFDKVMIKHLPCDDLHILSYSTYIPALKYFSLQGVVTLILNQMDPVITY